MRAPHRSFQITRIISAEPPDSQASFRTPILFRQNNFPARQIGVHQALEELAVIGNLEVEEFVDDDIVLEHSRFLKKIGTETDPSLA